MCRDINSVLHAYLNMWIQQYVETAVIMLGCRQDMEIEIDRFEMARTLIAEVGCSCVLVSRFDVLEHCLLEHCLLERCP